MNLLGTFKTEKLDMGQLLWLLYQSSDPAYNDAWKDKGTGQLSIKCKEGVNKGTGEFKPTILVRNDVNGVIMDLSRPGLVLLIRLSFYEMKISSFQISSRPGRECSG